MEDTMSTFSPEELTGSLEPLEFGGRDLTVACTPAAVDLAAVGLAAAGFGYFAAKAWYHGHHEDMDKLIDGGAARQELLSSSDLLSARTDEITRG
jgi:hypothetical protein